MKRFEQLIRTPGPAYAFLAIAAFFWGAGAVILRGVHQELPPVGISFWRTFSMAVLLLPFVYENLRRQWPLIARHWKLIAFFGFAQVGGMTCMSLAANFTTAINLSLVNAAQPAVTAVVAWFIIRDRLSPAQIVGILAALAGVTIMTVRADWQVLASFSFNKGDLIMLAAILGWSLYSVKMLSLPREFGLATLLFVVMFAGSMTVLPLYLLETAYYMPMPVSWTSVWAVSALAFMVSLLAISFWNGALRTVGANRATIFLTLIPVFGAILAILTLGESLYSFHVVGAAFVCGGIVLMIRTAPRRSRSVTEGSSPNIERQE